MSQHRPKVSVVMATHNRAHSVSRAVESVLIQEACDFELIIVDDGSSDETYEILRYYEGKDERVRTIRRRHQGLVRSLNTGLELASGDYIARLDDDDIWIDSRKLMIQVRFLASHPRCGVVGTWAERDYGNHKELQCPPNQPGALVRHFWRANPFNHSTVMFLRSMHGTCVRYSSCYSHLEDYALWSEFLENGFEFGMITEVMVRTSHLRSGVSKSNRLVQQSNRWRLIRDLAKKGAVPRRAVLFTSFAMLLMALRFPLVLMREKKMKKSA